jgi:LAO/AO transport system kinase
VNSAELVDRLLAGERRALARLLTYVEDGSRERLREVVRLLHPHTGSAHLVGITGSPGVGKSTLTSALISEWRGRGRRVAVLAVDPSSPFSGGALLGDRVRMQDHVLDDGVFIRSMASRGHLGGLSWATPQALLVLDAAGFDLVVVETVGVGQAEVEIASMADTTVVTLAPGMGDAIQAAKAGILEVADVFCVNKADHDGTDRLVRDLRGMQELGAGGRGAVAGGRGSDDAAERPAPIRTTVAAREEGIAELADAIDEHRAWLTESGLLEDRRLGRARVQLREIALGEVRSRFAALGEGALADELAAAVAARRLDPYTAADRMIDGLDGLDGLDA